MTDCVHILVGRSLTLGGEIIRMFDNGVSHHWSHGAVLLPGHQEVIDSRALHGVQRRDHQEFHLQYSRSRLVSFEVPNAAAGYLWLAQQVGKSYDYLAVLGRLARRGWQDDSRWHCWELVEGFLAASGLHRWRDQPQRITPNMGYSNLCGVADA